MVIEAHDGAGVTLAAEERCLAAPDAVRIDQPVVAARDDGGAAPALRDDEDGLHEVVRSCSPKTPRF